MNDWLTFPKKGNVEILQLRNNGVHINENVIVMTVSYKVNYEYIKPSYSLVYLIKCKHFYILQQISI